MDSAKILTARIVLLTILLSGMLLVPAAVLLAKMLISRLSLFQTGVRAIAAGDFTTRLPVDSEDELGAFAEGFNHMAQGLEQRERMKHFVSEQVWAEVRKEDKQSLALGGEKCATAILFSHIHGFDAFIGRNSPDAVVDLLNAYFTGMDEAVRAQHGSIDKLIGDAVMAVFHEVSDRPSPALRAVKAAQGMLAREDELNRCRRERGESAIRTDIGIHFGTVISGKIGSEHGLIDFTVIGDAVNTAARLQSHAAGQASRSIIVSAAVQNSALDGFTWVALPSATVKGKSEKLEVFRLDG